MFQFPTRAPDQTDAPPQQLYDIPNETLAAAEFIRSCNSFCRKQVVFVGPGEVEHVQNKLEPAQKRAFNAACQVLINYFESYNERSRREN